MSLFVELTLLTHDIRRRHAKLMNTRDISTLVISVRNTLSLFWGVYQVSSIKKASIMLTEIGIVEVYVNISHAGCFEYSGTKISLANKARIVHRVIMCTL